MVNPDKSPRWIVWAVWLIACAAGSKTAEVHSEGLAPAAAPAQQVERKPQSLDHGQVVLLPAGRDAVTVDVEVVYRPADRQKGLMYRRELAGNAGMLFLFEQERQQSFWMHNTYLPLDMVFIRSDMSVLGVVENAEPLTDISRRVEGPSQFVLEVNAGFCRKAGITAGTMVRFEGISALKEVGVTSAHP